MAIVTLGSFSKSLEVTYIHAHMQTRREIDTLLSYGRADTKVPKQEGILTVTLKEVPNVMCD